MTLKIYSQGSTGSVPPRVITSVDLQGIFCTHSTQGTSLEVPGSSVWGMRAVFYRPSAV